jgi:hypothetical protein
MGFKPERTIYRLNFSGTFLDGLLIRVGSLTVAEYNEMLSKGSSGTADEAMAANRWVAQLFLDRLVEWNLENQDGTPTPKTVEGLQAQERPVVTGIINAWQIAMVNIPAPLSQSSSDGGLLDQEESLGLGDQSQSL